MAESHGDVRVLPEWTIAHMDWLVPSASAKLVSHRDGRSNSGNGTSACLDGISRPPVESSLFLHRHRLADRSDRHSKLHFSQLPRPRIGIPPSGRHVPAPLHPATIQSGP